MLSDYVILQHKDYYYYFDSNNELNRILRCDAVKFGLVNKYHGISDTEVKNNRKRLMGEYDGMIFYMAFCRCNPKCSIDDFKDIYREVYYLKNLSVGSDCDALVTKIDRPIFYRETGNDNTHTFDFIKVNMCLRYEFENKHNFILQHQQDLKELAVMKIENSKQFKKYDIPIEFLKLSNAVLRCDDVLEFTFELKDM